VHVLSPAGRRTFPCPTYPEIRLALFAARGVRRELAALAPDAIHIATEGPLGHAARRYCLQRRLSFTTSYHTQFPQYVRERLPIPTQWTYAYLRRYHGAARRTLVPTEMQRRELVAQHFTNVVIWSRGVDTETFQPYGRTAFADLPRPIFLYAGRIAVEKNLEAFLALDLPGTKVMIGDGPHRHMLEQRFPAAHFVGYQFGAELGRQMAAADVFVFPSRTDTFGLVMLEALACGTPVAAFPVTGPIDVVSDGVDGVLHEDLRTAALGSLELDRGACRRTALERTWQAASRQFFGHLVRATDGVDLAARVL
jgi:glycosyltransferase involved in cell wall biosynthesis